MEPMCDHCHQYRSQHKPGGKGCTKFYWDPGPRRIAHELDALTAGPSDLLKAWKAYIESFNMFEAPSQSVGPLLALAKAIESTATVAPAVDEELRERIYNALLADADGDMFAHHILARCADIAAQVVAASHTTPSASSIDRDKLLARIATDIQDSQDQKKDKYLDGNGHSCLDGAIRSLEDLVIAIERGDFTPTAQPVTTNSSLEEWLCHETSYLMRDVGIDKEYSQRVVQSLMAAHARGDSDNEETAAFIAAQPPHATVEDIKQQCIDLILKPRPFEGNWTTSTGRFVVELQKAIAKDVDAAIQQEARTGGSDE